MPLQDFRRNTMKILHPPYESRGDCFGIGGAGMRADFSLSGWVGERNNWKRTI
jgi:hypothetical protein